MGGPRAGGGCAAVFVLSAFLCLSWLRPTVVREQFFPSSDARSFVHLRRLYRGYLADMATGVRHTERLDTTISTIPGLETWLREYTTPKANLSQHPSSGLPWDIFEELGARFPALN